MDLENKTLSKWDKIGRAGRLARETPEWREKRLEAENPKSSRKSLISLADDIRAFHRANVYPEYENAYLLAEALAAHPNLPPELIGDLLDWSPQAARAFCRNPIAPKLLLEIPNFFDDLSALQQLPLLDVADLPQQFVQRVATDEKPQKGWAKKDARLHIAFAGEAATREEWIQQLCDIWKEECAVTNWHEQVFVRQAHANLAEIGLAPLWALGVPPFEEPMAHFPRFWFAHTAGSSGEKALLEGIKLGVEDASDKAIVAHSLRNNATVADLHTLLDLVESIVYFKRGSIYAAILQHPAVDGEIIRRIVEIDAEREKQRSAEIISIAESREGNLGFYRRQILAPTKIAPPYPVSRMIASHPHTPTDVLVHLLEVYDPNDNRLARNHRNAPLDAGAVSRRAFFHSAHRHWSGDAAFVSFVWCLQFMWKLNEHPYDLDNLPDMVESSIWTQRLQAIFLADAKGGPVPGDSHERTGRDLLEHLTFDANRLVRAAARTRLLDPDFVFTWTD